MIRATEAIEKLAKDLRAIGVELYAKDTYSYFLAGDTHRTTPPADLVAIAGVRTAEAKKIIDHSGISVLVIPDVRCIHSYSIRSILPWDGKYEILSRAQYELDGREGITLRVDGNYHTIPFSNYDTIENLKAECDRLFPNAKTIQLIDKSNRVLNEWNPGRVYTVRRPSNYEKKQFATVFLAPGEELTYEAADEALKKN